MEFKMLASVPLLLTLIGTHTGITGATPAVYSPWGSRFDPLPAPQFYDRGRQQYQGDMATANADPIDKLMNYLNYATPSRIYSQNYKFSRNTGPYYRPNEKYENYNKLNNNHQARYNNPTVSYDMVGNPNNKGVVDSFANAVGIKLPVTLNIRDIIDAILKLGQNAGVVIPNPANSNKFTLLENNNSDKQNDYVPRPSSDLSTPSNVIQFNIIKLDSSHKVPDLPNPGAQNEFEPRPDYTQSNCASHSHPGHGYQQQFASDGRFLAAPPPYWMHSPYDYTTS